MRRINKRSVCCSGMAGMVLGAVPLSEGSAPNDAPNVIVFMLDDQGFLDAGIFGHPYMKTPHLDRLAREGTIFNQYYVPSTVCSPSRVGFVTGRFPGELGIHGIVITYNTSVQRNTGLYMPRVPTIMNVLRDVGYRTAHYGKWHMTAGGGRMPEVPTPDDYGLDELRLGGGWGAMPAPRFDTDIEKYRAHSTGMFVDEAIDFIRRNPEGTPFFVNIWTLVPHSPLDPTDEELAVYEDLVVSLDDFEGYMRRYVEQAGVHGCYHDQMRVYCAAMTGLDKQLGRLLDFLDESGLTENTLFIFTSDNGPEDFRAGSESRNAGMGHPGVHRARKRSLYEGGARVPFVVRWPARVPAGRIDHDSVLNSVDMLPTLASIAGVPKDVIDGIELSGEDVSGALLGGSHDREKPLFWEWRYGVAGFPAWGYEPPSLAIRYGDWKLFCEPDGSDIELYNIPQDPEERDNVAAEHPEVVQRLKMMLLEWRSGVPEGPLTPFPHETE